MDLKALQTNNNPKVGEFAGYLLNSAVQGHIYHLQTKSFAAHKALNEFYDAMPEMADSLIESFQGKYGIIKKYMSFVPLEDDNPIAYLTKCLEYVNNNRYTTFKKEDTNLQNEIDNVVTLIEGTLYKLKFLS